ncbi:tRNA-dihydrouridine synthase family protein [Odoribacter sp. OttesenSCG-928-G04]|nr:tRNA-dihydrouridine synthase family protein [Odoribacter sp. OttesenSCG-928-G04]
MQQLHFAPLQGFTDYVYRNMHSKHFGCIDVYYTPFIRLESGKSFRNKDIKDVAPEQNETENLIPQVIAGEAEELRLLIGLLIEKGHRKIDLNMGCPFPMLANKQKGSGILPYPEKVRILLDVIRDFPNITFSLKLRLGWNDPEECLKLIPLLNEAPLSHIALHARVGIQQYKGEVDLNAFGRFYELCKHPLIYNGDLLTVSDIQIITEQFPRLQGIMIGRGLLADPALAMEYKTGISLTSRERSEKYRLFHDELYTTYAGILQGDHQVLNKMKTLWEYFMPATNKKVLKKIKKSSTLSGYQTAVNEALHS